MENKEEQLKIEMYEDELLHLIEDRELYTISDLQSLVSVLVKKIRGGE